MEQMLSAFEQAQQDAPAWVQCGMGGGQDETALLYDDVMVGRLFLRPCCECASEEVCMLEVDVH